MEKETNFDLIMKKSGFFYLLEQAASDAKEASRYFGEFAIKGSFGEKENEKILAIKVHCDEKFREIENKLNLSDISSSDRENIRLLAYNFKKITDILYTISNNIRTCNIDKNVNEYLVRFAGPIEVSVDCLLRALRGLLNPDENNYNINYCTEVNRQGRLGEGLKDHVLTKHFADSHKHFLKDIFFDAATVLDKCVDAADIIKNIPVKRE